MSTPSLTPFSVVLALGAAQGSLLALSLIGRRRDNVSANGFLAALLLVFVLDLVDELALQSGYFALAPRLTAVNWAVDLLFGPLIYLYARTLTEPAPWPCSPRPRVLAHFGPFFGALFAVLASMSAFAARDFHAQVYGDGPVALGFVEGGMVLGGFVSMATYLLLSLSRVRTYRREIKNRLSSVERVDLRWLRTMLYVLIALFSLYALTALVEFSTSISDFEDRALYPAIVLTIYTMGFLGLRQPRLFDDARDLGGEDRAEAEPAVRDVEAVDDATNPPRATREGASSDRVREPLPKYRRSSLSARQSAAILDEIRALMETEKPFLDSRLSLPILAARLGLSTNVVSQAINEAGGVNFFDFVNGYRVVEAQRRLRDTGDNILTVAMDSGFNSKTAFYKAFGRHCGHTPHRYRVIARSDAA